MFRLVANYPFSWTKKDGICASVSATLFCEVSFKNDVLAGHFGFRITIRFLKQLLDGRFKSTTKKLRGRRQHTTPVTATRYDPCQVTLPRHETCSLSASVASNIELREREILAPATRKASFPTLFKSTTPANVCNCRELLGPPGILQRVEILAPATKRSLKFKRMPRNRQVLAILASKLLSCHSAVQNFANLNFQKRPDTASFFTILISELFSRRGVVRIFWGFSAWGQRQISISTMLISHLISRQCGANFGDVFGSRSSATPVFGSRLPAKLWNYRQTRRFAFPSQAPSCPISVLYRVSLLTDFGRRFSAESEVRVLSFLLFYVCEETATAPTWTAVWPMLEICRVNIRIMLGFDAAPVLCPRKAILRPCWKHVLPTCCQQGALFPTRSIFQLPAKTFSKTRRCWSWGRSP